MSRYPPIVGQWFQETESGQVFEIVAYDRDGGTVQVQYLDGDRAAFDAHLKSAHFKTFDAKVAPWILEKNVRCYLLD